MQSEPFTLKRKPTTNRLVTGRPAKKVKTPEPSSYEAVLPEADEADLSAEFGRLNTDVASPVNHNIKQKPRRPGGQRGLLSFHQPLVSRVLASAPRRPIIPRARSDVTGRGLMSASTGQSYGQATFPLPSTIRAPLRRNYSSKEISIDEEDADIDELQIDVSALIARKNSRR
jgi:hypothetical protein